MVELVSEIGLTPNEMWDIALNYQGLCGKIFLFSVIAFFINIVIVTISIAINDKPFADNICYCMINIFIAIIVLIILCIGAPGWLDPQGAVVMRVLSGGNA